MLIEHGWTSQGDAAEGADGLLAGSEVPWDGSESLWILQPGMVITRWKNLWITLWVRLVIAAVLCPGHCRLTAGNTHRLDGREGRVAVCFT